MSAKNTY